MIVASATLPATAQSPADAAGWATTSYGRYNPDYVRKVGKGDYEVKEGVGEDKATSTGLVAFTRTPDAPSVMLNCSDKGRLAVAFSLTPTDFSDKAVLYGDEGGLRARYGEVWIAGTRIEKRQRFILRLKSRIAFGVGEDLAYRVIDAIYAGEPVTLRVTGQPEVTYQIPKPDTALADFIKACPGFES